MSETTPKFENDWGEGTCDICGEENVPLKWLSDGYHLCESCWDSEVKRCGICGGLFISCEDVIHFDDDRQMYICDYCASTLDDEEESTEDEE